MILSYPRLIADLTGYGATTDKTVTEALAVIEQARATRNATPIDDLRTEYASGQITSRNTTERIIAAATLAAAAERIHLASSAVEDAANGTLRRWIGSHHDRLVKALRPAFDDAAARVQAAAELFAPGTSDRELVAAGSRAVALHEGLDATLSTLAHIRSLRAQVAECAGAGEQHVTWYILAARDAKALEAAERAYTGGGDAFHALAHAGFTLRLNTIDEAAKVAAGAAAATEAAETEARAALVASRREEYAGWMQPKAS